MDGAPKAPARAIVPVSEPRSEATVSEPAIEITKPRLTPDQRIQADVMDLLADLNRRDGRTIVTVLHDLHLAATRIPRIVVVADGRIVADGAPGEALGGERIRDVFGVDPALLPEGPWSRLPAERVPAGG